MTGENGFVPSELYTQALQFYAHQMRAHDATDYMRFAATFTEDGRFTHGAPDLDPVAVGRAAIVEALTKIDAAYYTDRPFQRRHYVNHLVLEQIGDERWQSEFYTVVLITTRTGTHILLSCITHDELVRINGALLTASRSVTLDLGDIPRELLS